MSTSPKGTMAHQPRPVSTSREHEVSLRTRSDILGSRSSGPGSPNYVCARNLRVQQCQVHALCLPCLSTKVATGPVPVFQETGEEELRVELLQESASTVARVHVAVVEASGGCGDRPGSRH